MDDKEPIAPQPDPIPKKPRGPTCTIPEAGRYYFKKGRAASYALAKGGHIPTIRLGSRYVVPVSVLDRLVNGE